MEFGSVLPMLSDVLGSRVEITACSLLKEMQDYWVWDVQTHHPDLHLIVKLAGPRAAYTSAFERTAALHRLVRAQTSVSLPEVIAADESYEKWPWRYFIKAYLPGKEWAAVAQGTAAQGAGAEALTKARFQLGEAVAALHQIRFASFGELDDRAEVPEPLPFPDALEQRALRMIASPQAQDFVLSMLARKTALFQEIHTPALCHEDLHQYNLLLNWLNGEWCLVGILDFEKAWAGDREIDLARMDLWQMTGEPFWKAYQEHYPVDNGFADRKAVYQLIWCVEYAEDSAEQLDITQRLCQFLGLPVIKSFQPFQVKI